VVAAYNELDRSWNRVVRIMYLAKARRVFDHDRWAIMCYDHDGQLVAEGSVSAELSVEEALDAAEDLCPDVSSL
jgi:hypothetical protein